MAESLSIAGEERPREVRRLAALIALFRTANISVSPKKLRWLLRYRIDTFESRIATFVSYGFSRKSALALIAKNPRFITLDVSQVISSLEGAGFSRRRVSRLISTLSGFGFSVPRVLTRVRAIRRMGKFIRSKQKEARSEKLTDTLRALSHPHTYFMAFPAIMSYARRRIVFYNRLAVAHRLSEKVYRSLFLMNPYIVFAFLTDDSRPLDEAAVKQIHSVIRHMSREEKRHFIARGKEAVGQYRAEAGKSAPANTRKALLVLLARHLDS